MSTALTVQPIPAASRVIFSSPDEVLAQMQAIEDELACNAFSLFENRGYRPDSALTDWLDAESALLKPVPITIDEKGDQINVKADVPGFSPEQLKVHVEGKTLSICGKEESAQTGKKSANGAEQSSTSSRKIHCRIELPANVDGKRASATLDKGVLSLMLPKSHASTRVNVKVV